MTLAPVDPAAGDPDRTTPFQVFESPQYGPLRFHYVLAVDVQGFSRLSTRDQVAVQIQLSGALDEAARRAGLDRRTWHRQVAGDGELVVLPTDTDGLRLVADFPRGLSRALARVNAERYPAKPIRVRVAIHHGTLAPGCLGPVGRAPVVVSRLLDSGLLRRELVQRPEADLVLIVSASLYADVVETELGGLDPAEFERVTVRAKKASYPAYIHRAPLPKASPYVIESAGP